MERPLARRIGLHRIDADVVRRLAPDPRGVDALGPGQREEAVRQRVGADAGQVADRVALGQQAAAIDGGVEGVAREAHGETIAGLAQFRHRLAHAQKSQHPSPHWPQSLPLDRMYVIIKNRIAVEDAMSITPILQFGTSRFLQAHADLFISEALARGEALGPVTVVQSSGDARRSGRLAALASPGGFPVWVEGIENGSPVSRIVQVRSVARALSTGTDWPEIARIAAEEAEVILSNTGDAGWLASADDSAAEFRQGDRHDGGRSMRRNRIGRTSVEVTRLSFGCSGLGNLYRRIAEADAQAVLQRAWDRGIRYRSALWARAVRGAAGPVAGAGGGHRSGNGGPALCADPSAGGFRPDRHGKDVVAGPKLDAAEAPWPASADSALQEV